MQNPTSTYLYKFKKSSNYFFRIRYGNFDRTCHLNLKDKYFVASLGTSDYDKARWLALYIKCNLIKDKEMNMEKVQTSDHNNQELTKGRSVPEPWARAPIGEMTPFPEELSPRYVLAQQQYIKQLKDKFRLLLAAGKEIINHGVVTLQLGSLDALNDDELKRVTSGIETSSELSEKAELVNALLPERQPLITSNSLLRENYNRSVTMLNELIKALSKENEKFNSFDEIYLCNEELNASITNSFTEAQLLGGMVDMNIVLPMFRSLKDKLNGDVAAEKVVDDLHFSLYAQMDKFLAEKQGSIDDRTIVKYKTSFALLKELFPKDSDIREWRKQNMQKVKEMLSKRKARHNNTNSGKPMSSTTRNMYLSNYRTLFEWIITNTDVDIKNPFANTAFSKPKGKAKPPKRRSFSDTEVRKILSYKPMHGSEAKDFRRDANWYTKVCFYSSMRLNELSVLPLANVKEIDGIWCFDLRGLNLKNEASERVIPIAQYLLDMGILDYVKSLKKQKEKYFCPQIRRGKTKPGSSGWGDPISRWFNRSVLKNVGIDKEKELEKGSLICFHCTRRTFISTCVNNGEEKYLIKRLAGHSTEDDITLGTYSDIDKIDLGLLKQVIDRNLKWHQTDLNQSSKDKL